MDLVFEKASDVIIDKLFEHMKKPFVKKQLLQQMTESSIFGKNRADLNKVLIEDDED